MGERLRLFVYPLVKIEGEKIVHDASLGYLKARYATPRLLDDLAAVQTPHDALELARRYGPFFPPETPAPETTRRVVIEPIDVILDWCAWLPAATTMARMLASGRRAPDALTRALSLQPGARTDVCLSLELRLNRLMEATGLRPHVSWDIRSRRWELHVSNDVMAHRVSSAIGAAAYFALRRILEPDEGDVFASCAICGRIFQPARKPAAGRASYCPACRGSSEMWRMLKRRQRARG